MAVSVTVNDIDVWGSHQIRWATVTFDSSYPTNGEPITAADFNLSEIKNMMVAMPDVGDTMAGMYWDGSASTIVAVEQTGAEVASTHDIDGRTVEVLVIGK